MSAPFPDDHAREPAWRAAARERRGGDEYAELVAAQRLLLDLFAGSAPPPEVAQEATRRLRELADLLGAHQAAEADRFDGMRVDIPGRAMALLPPYVVDEVGDGEVRGHVRFGRFYLGGGAAAHGGAHTLLFDDVMGYLAGTAGGMCRTAYLTINYRRITPLDLELRFDARLDSVDGRKRFLSARLYNPAGEIVSDCSGLFLRLLPGQQ